MADSEARRNFRIPSTLDLLMEQSRARSTANARQRSLRHIFVHTLEKMARGGVYDQLAGGFHRYSVDERWIVPHFEKMSYDNSELLKNYVHAYQATSDEFFADVARDIIRWMDEWLSDRAHGGFYASQDADYSMDDDGDYFTWTLDEARAVLTEDEARVAELHYDIGEIGEMHHNPAKNVLYIRAGDRRDCASAGPERRPACATCWLPRRKRCMRHGSSVPRPMSTRPSMRDGMRCACRRTWKQPTCSIWRRRIILRCARLDRLACGGMGRRSAITRM